MMNQSHGLLRKSLISVLILLVAVTFLGMDPSYAAAKKPAKLKVSSSVKMTTAYTKKLNVKVTPSNSSKVTFKSSNPSIVSVSKSGKMTGKKLGTAKITVKTAKKTKSGKYLTKKVKVTVGICDTTKASEVKAYASDSSAKTVLVDARTADSYSGWALGSDKVGGHLKNAVSFSAQWLTVPYTTDTNEKHIPASENQTREDLLNRELKSNGMTKSKSYIIYDTNGKDAKTVAKYLINKKGFRSVCVYNAKKEFATASTKTESYKNYNLYVPAEVVKNISDHVVKGTALNDQAKTIVGDNNIVILDAAYASTGKYTKDGYNMDAPIDWSQEAYAKGHVPGAYPISTDDFEPEEPTDRSTSTSYRLRHTANGDIDDAKLIELAEKAGVTKDSCVIVTGFSSTLATSRIAVILKYLGVNNIHIMSEQKKGWEAKGYDLETGVNTPKQVSFGADKALNPDVIDTTAEFEKGLKRSDFQGVDMRTDAEWNGLDSGYGYHDLAGRIAGTVHSPSGIGWNSSIVNYENPDFSMRTPAEIEALWKATGVDPSKHLSFFCGSGWRVSEVVWDAWVMGYTNTSIYSDGWQVWSNSGNDYIDKNGNTVHYDNATKTVVASK
ncbi:rhodanese-like domain-containing protein [Eubacterium pyruvativorans]|uniref:rhodanese-like domain-containing protein n=1 Tax=Eubacterium pyruvativorans TaxID=155865 RepID=UPI001568FACC|nr:rhodanese-like domain-containing protein [Eubacterium pyruvativorans]MDD6707248.1 rhodanese-like domain-containing protein [Eubacterium pyruvativorans]